MNKIDRTERERRAAFLRDLRDFCLERGYGISTDTEDSKHEEGVEVPYMFVYSLQEEANAKYIRLPDLYERPMMDVRMYDGGAEASTMSNREQTPDAYEEVAPGIFRFTGNTRVIEEN